jgi:hypothetical protein
MFTAAFAKLFEGKFFSLFPLALSPPLYIVDLRTGATF